MSTSQAVEEKKLGMAQYAKKSLVAVGFIVVIGLLTLGSGMIVKLFTKANYCNNTKMMLFVSGIVLALVLSLLGYLYGKIDTETSLSSKYINKLKAWTERFRYRTIGGNGLCATGNC
jgi:hypothetical protein